VVIQSPKSTFARFAVLGALLAALGLAGCVHNGGLDAPPMAAAAAGDLDWLDRPPAPPPRVRDAPPPAASDDLEASGQPAPASTQAAAGTPVSPPAETIGCIIFSDEPALSHVIHPRLMLANSSCCASDGARSAQRAAPDRARPRLRRYVSSPAGSGTAANRCARAKCGLAIGRNHRLLRRRDCRKCAGDKPD